MPTVKISDLNPLTTAPASDDLVVVVDSSTNETKKETIANFFQSPTISGNTYVGGTISIGSTTTINGQTNMFNLNPAGYGALIAGQGQSAGGFSASGSLADTLYLKSTNPSLTAGSGGAVLFGTEFGNQTPFAGIKGKITDGSSYTIGHLAFYTRGSVGDSSMFERMVLTNTGNLGIATTNPAGLLHVVDAAGDKGYIFRNGYIDFVNAINSAYSVADFNATRYNFHSGYVGINNPSPATHLDVGGSISGDDIFLSKGTYCPTQVTSGSVSGQFAANAGGSVDVRSTTAHSLKFYTSNTERSQIDANGIHYFNCTSIPAAGVQGVTIEGSNSVTHIKMGHSDNLGNYFEFFGSSAQVGSIVCAGGTTQYNTTSDYRVKENIVDLTGALERVNSLNPIRFNFIGQDNTVDGFLAHEVQAVVPESVHGEKDAVDENGEVKLQGIDQSKLVPVLVAAIKEITARLEALESGA